MANGITYQEFKQLVVDASGTFCYVFDGRRYTCDPELYKVRNGTSHLPKPSAR